MKRTPLFTHHQKLQAKMAPFAGYEMPLYYSSVKKEVQDVRNHVGLFDISHMGELFIEGEKAEDFVDFLLCNDFKSLPPKHALYSPLCHEQGGILDDVIAYKLSPSNIMICVNAVNIEKDWHWISSQGKAFPSLQLSNRSPSYASLAIQGPKSLEMIKQQSLLPKEETPPFTLWEKGNLMIARTGYTGEDGVEIFAPSNEIPSLWEHFLSLKVTPCGLASRDVLRLEAGYPLYGHELTEDLTPFDSGLAWTVKFQGNFLGKKAMESYAPRYKLVKLSLEKGIPRRGYPVENSSGEKIGQVTSGSFSITLGKGICMALVEKNQFPKDKMFFVSIRQKSHLAHYHPKNFLQKV